MTVAIRQRSMSRETFFGWARAQAGRWEFDGFEPVAMTGGTLNHSQVVQNVQSAPRARVTGDCRHFGPETGIATIGDAVRYPDAVVTSSRVDGRAHLVPDPVVVFEVLSPTSGRIDRIDNLREYRAVSPILRYAILEYASAVAELYARIDLADLWPEGVAG